MTEEKSNSKNTNTGNVSSGSGSSLNESSGNGSNSTTSSSIIMRQNLSNSKNVNSPTKSGAENCSNENNLSTNTGSMSEGNTAPGSIDSLQEANTDKGKIKNTISILNPNLMKNIKEENEDNTHGTMKPDDVITLMNVKKEDNHISPNLSPVGFNALSSSCKSNEVKQSPTTELTGNTGNDKGLALGSNSNNISGGMADKRVGGISNNNSPQNDSACNNSGSNNINAQNAANHIFSGMGNNGNNGGSNNNCTDYMQQQNHIFVFSTQLANKGAESVLGGLFPTIIAYHCTQPATKSFLEDFFIKNPLKMAKLRSQNANNIGPNGQCWLPLGSNLTSMAKTEQQKNINCASNKSNQLNSNGCNSNLTSNIADIKPTLHANVLPGFPEPADDLHDEQDLLCWDQSSNMRNHLENASLNELKMLEDEDNIDAKIKTAQLSANADNDGNIPSLQGVKVPDENLTPQQRQHREEQLAKLKKMNQFLFPENGSDFNVNNKLGSSEVIASSVNNIIMNIPINNQQLRNTTANMNLNKQQQQQHKICTSENASGIREESISSSELLAPNNGGQLSNPGNGNFGGSTVTNAMNIQAGIHIGNTANRGNNCHLTVCQPNINNINGPNTNNTMLPDVINSRGINLNQNCNINGNMEGATMGNKTNLSGAGELNQSGITGHGMEWSKLQNQIFEERMRGNNQAANEASNISSNVICRSNSISGANANSRSNPSGIIPGTRSIQGPPPPYHPIRSASVPIATQSPNPTSPNNATSNLSLPSPHNNGNNALINGLSSTSPNIDSQNITPTTPTSGIITDSQAVASNSQSKNQNFPLQSHSQEGSPTNGNVSGVRNNRSSSINQFNSNPSTPLSHISPKDMEAYNANGVAVGGDLKNTRPSPQRAKTPSNTNNIGDVASNIEGHFSNASPGLNFPQHNVGGNGPYKSPGSIERQHSAPTMSSAQFCRRADNMPLNPNSNRLPQSKINHQFDPISSLAQMSQQLTSCVPTSGNMSIINTDQINISGNGNPNLEGIMNSLESGNIDHCNSSNMMPSNMQPLMNNSGGAAGPFPGGSHSNLHSHGPMGQRILNPKLIGGPMGFNSNNSNLSLREVPGNFPGNYSQRMMGGIGRIPIGNFNVSPNIQVKASTPNTIQYMPVRPQNHSNNMRVPPSVEFLQRYANPQMTAAGANNSCGINIMENSNMGSINSNIIASNLGENNKIGNNANNTVGVVGGNLGIAGGNFFSNQMVNVDQDELGNASDFGLNMGSMHSQMIRPNMRNMRQSNIKGNPPQDLLEIPDNPNMFGGATNSQLFGGVQMKSNIKNVNVGPPNICQNMNTANPGVNNSQMTNQGLLQNEHNPVMQSPLILGQNNTNNLMHMNNNNNSNSANPQCGIGLSNIGPNAGNANYKSFVGPVPNDLKYAQQYHSFQQQLYATSTRGGGTSNLNSGSSPSAFFVNK